jgi:hypothetical protein
MNETPTIPEVEDLATDIGNLSIGSKLRLAARLYERGLRGLAHAIVRSVEQELHPSRTLVRRSS